MGNISEYTEFLTIISVFIYTAISLKYELQMMQQNSYRNIRYLRWLKLSFLSRYRIEPFLAVIIVFIFNNQWLNLALALILALKGVSLFKEKYKKPLVFTSRAKRLYITGIALVLIIYTTVYFLGCSLIKTSFVVASLSFVIMMLSIIANNPIDRLLNKWYYNDAKQRLKQMPNLTIIGITGSYGKTSTKHYLYRILSESFNVLITPGSFNTTLGVIRTIREQLKPYHNIFIVEMGAKQIGDIKEICDLVAPSIAIITAVGEQHLESFKTIENVQKTKFELVDALPSSGFAVVNNDFPYIANRKIDNVAHVRYAMHPVNNPDCTVSNIEYLNTETKFTVEYQGESLNLTTKLLGEANLSNILGAYVVAKHLGMDNKAISIGVNRIEQVEHRLSLKRTGSGITIIDDAFNSNPHGAEMALKVLANFQGEKKIVITPGLIELGTKQFDYNKQFGESIAKYCDYAIIVGKYNQQAISAGLIEKNFPKEKMHFAETFLGASKHLNTIVKKGDVVLYENDLPDTFK